MKTLLIGERYREKLGFSLISNEFEVFWLPENYEIDQRLASHADLSAFRFEKKLILANYLKNSCELVKLLTSRGYEVIISDQIQNPVYPGDVNLCAATLGSKLIHNNKYTDPKILSLGVEVINVKQGYSRCTALILDENCAITADKGIAEAISEIGVEVLQIAEGGIELDGFSNGFIGGASFKAEDTIYFTGVLENHPSGKIIKNFIIKHGYKICCLTNEHLFDIGGAIYIE